ncbi:MAG: YdbH domain-containing protein [Sphingomonadaceae bacterium]
MRSRLRRNRGLVILLLAAGGAGIVLWGGRFIIARPFISDYLQARGVEARYRIEALTADGATLTNVSLGPPGRPEFTAERIRVTWRGLREPAIEKIVVEKPVLRAAITGDGLTMGSLDALMPAPSDEPLPAIDVSLTDAQLLLETPYGSFRMDARGDGVLRDGFHGVGTVRPVELRVDTDCSLHLDDMRLTLTTGADHLTVEADAASPSALCQGVQARDLALTGHVRSDPAMLRWSGTLQMSGTDARHDAGHVSRPQFTLGFAGDLSRWQGQWSVHAGNVAWSSGKAGVVSASGAFNADKSGAVLFAGQTRATDVSLALPDARAAPEFAAHLAGRAAKAMSRFEISAPVSGHFGKAGFMLHVPDATVEAASGARLTFDGDGLSYAGGQWTMAGKVGLAGGGLPEGRVDLDLRDEHFTVHGQLRYSGETGGGLEVSGLSLQGKAEGHTGAVFAVAPGCIELDFRAVRHPAVRLGPARLSACPDDKLQWQNGRLNGALQIAPIKLNGQAGEGRQAFMLETGRLRLKGGKDSYALAPAKVSLSYGDLDVAATLSVHSAGDKLTGTVADVSLASADLPVEIDAGEGEWTFGGGQWRLSDGAVQVRDLEEWPRFQPLVISGVTANLAGGKIHAQGKIGLVNQPAAQRAALAQFTVEHDLASARGSATADTGNLRLGPGLQPYQITERLRGVIENVRGTVQGTAKLRWDGSELSGTGDVALHDVSLATAAFGPVDGINGRVHFTDLLKIKSPPGQELTIAAINPGILVEKGRVLFQLMGNGDVEVEQAEWPFSGGILSLQTMLFDFDATARSFTLLAEGLDAGLFLQGLDLKDVNATGKFDGKLPVEFIDGKGRITDGVLTARAPGGLVSYTGNVGADQMGAAGELAFDALRQLRYRQLQLKLNGDLDGELVTEILLEGTNENPVKPGGSPMEMAGLPFRFNISIRAPFRRLLGTAASFSDARTLIQSGAKSPPPKEDGKIVQPR